MLTVRPLTGPREQRRPPANTLITEPDLRVAVLAGRERDPNLGLTYPTAVEHTAHRSREVVPLKSLQIGTGPPGVTEVPGC